MGNSSQFALGYAEAAAVFSSFPAVFAGETVDNTAVLVRRTRYGDANLDRTVNLPDFNNLAGSFGASSTVWSQGNFNFDNSTNLPNFNPLAGNFGQTAGPFGVDVINRELRPASSIREEIRLALPASRPRE